MAKSSLITDHRPPTFDDVVGHRAVVKALRHAVDNNTAKAFLFSGRPGVGKTTFAYILSRALAKTDKPEIIEIDAATYTGIDDMRALTAGLQFRPFHDGKGGKEKVRVILIDEVHALSAPAFKSLLKSVENPPSWVFWIFCTSEPQRVPAAIQRRCMNIKLDPISNDDLFNLLVDVVEKEEIDVSDDVLDICVKHSNGSPGVALDNLTLCAACKTRQEAARLLAVAEASGEAIELCRALINGSSWQVLQPILVKLQTLEPESIRHQVRGYFTSALLKTSDPNKAAFMLTVLDAFSTPFFGNDGFTPVLLAVGRCCFAAE